MEYLVNLDTFEGPFELLVYLIEQREVDIYDIPISDITEQYLDYLDKMKSLNLNITSEFILMAATLIEIKSQMLLPRKEKETEDPRMQLVNQILEYKKCKEASEKLKEFESQSGYYIAKPKEDIEFKNSDEFQQFSINEVNAYELYNIFIKLLKEKNFNIEVKPVIANKIYRDSFRVKDCSDMLIEKIKNNGKVSIFQILKEKKDISNLKEYVISIFLAILEMSKDNNIKIYQNVIFSDIELVYDENKEAV